MKPARNFLLHKGFHTSTKNKVQISRYVSTAGPIVVVPMFLNELNEAWDSTSFTHCSSLVITPNTVCSIPYSNCSFKKKSTLCFHFKNRDSLITTSFSASAKSYK